MTQDPVSFYPDDDVHNVYLKLIRNDYDAAPVRDRKSEDCLGLVSKAELTGPTPVHSQTVTSRR